MEIPLRISKRMNSANWWFGSVERTLIRIPQDMREEHDLHLGDFVDLRTKDGTIVSLQIATAYKPDVEEDSLRAYVTKEIFDIIGVEGETCTQNVNLVTGITLGCDPEFFLVRRDTNKLVHAGYFFNKLGEVGYDHDGLLMEIRPLPSESEIIVTNNLFKLINRARSVIMNINAHYGNMVMMYGASSFKTMTAGFHLHFGLPKQILGPGPLIRLVAMQIVKALDYYVGVPGIIPEGVADCRRRTKPFVEYGKPGNYRLDARTLEYRVPGGSLLRHPKLARGIIGLGAVVVEDAVSRIHKKTDGFKNLKYMTSDDDIRELYPNIPNIHDLFYMICSFNVEAATNHVKTIIDDVKQMVSYKNRQKAVDDFFESILSGEVFDNDIEYNWRKFYNEEQQRKMDIFPTSF